MPQPCAWIAAAGLASLLVAPSTVEGHIYLVESRQYYNSAAYQDENFKNLEKYAGAYNAGGEEKVQQRARRLTDSAILEEYGSGSYPLRSVYDKGDMAPNGNYIEPQGISVRHGVCGDPKSGDQGGKEGDNTYSTPNEDWPILQQFTQGEVMEIKAVVQAWKYGHLEFFLCDTGDLDDPNGVATQECFNRYPLTRADGDGVNSPIDPNYPGRYYVDPPCRVHETNQYYDWRAGGGYVLTMNYQLPQGLVCEHCVLQMWYFTGHKCSHPGYEEFNPPSWGSECAPKKSDWIDTSVDYCGDTKASLPEEYWACSDISISSDGPSALVVHDGNGKGEAVYMGCFHDDKTDRVLENQFSSSSMTTEVCRAHCMAQGAAFMATQWGIECWCSADVNLDYERHLEGYGVDPVCDMFCQGNPTEYCGGLDSFDLYKLQKCSGVNEQCDGGKNWTGSTCCSDGNVCTVTRNDNYSECRPSVPSTPAPVPPAPSTPPPVPSTPSTPAPVSPTPSTPPPVGETPTSGCMVVRIEAEDLAMSGDWRVVEDSAASGGKYIVWLGLQPEANNRHAREGDLISTSIYIPTAGTYSFKWRMRQPKGVESDKGNDAWLNFPDADRYGPADTNENYGRFIKVYGRAREGVFKYSGTGEDSRGHTEIAIEFRQAGEYTMEIRGRSHGLEIDTILVFGQGLSVKEADSKTGC